jgi:hypothetical protein
LHHAKRGANSAKPFSAFVELTLNQLSCLLQGVQAMVNPPAREQFVVVAHFNDAPLV